METLKDFYLRIRPAGWWRPVRRIILSENPDIPSDSFTMDILTVIIGATGLQALYLISIYACTHQWQAFTVAFLVVAGCAVALYFTWYKNLPSKDEDVQLV